MCSYSGYSKDYMIHPYPFFTSSENTSCKREVDLSLRVGYLHFNVRFPLHVFDVLVMWWWSKLKGETCHQLCNLYDKDCYQCDSDWWTVNGKAYDIFCCMKFQTYLWISDKILGRKMPAWMTWTTKVLFSVFEVCIVASTVYRTYSYDMFCILLYIFVFCKYLGLILLH
jgi:hypothetical protein